MRTTTVPAQVTTVEDRIAGSLTFPQLLLLMTGFGLATLAYLFVAPAYHATPMKLVVIASVALLFGLLAIRLYGRLLGEWLILLMRYVVRPRRYIFTKNDRSVEEALESHSVRELPVDRTAPQELAGKFSTKHTKLETLMENPDLSIRFVATKNGGLHVALIPTKD